MIEYTLRDLAVKEKRPMTLIRNKDFIQSVADALQYISYYHPIDFVQAVHQA